MGEMDGMRVFKKHLKLVLFKCYVIDKFLLKI